ncbi:sugar ABC transporter substrate-binding protein [Streptomyces tendae]
MPSSLLKTTGSPLRCGISTGVISASKMPSARGEQQGVKKLIAQHADAIILQSLDNRAIERDIPLADEAGIPVFLVETTVMEKDKLLGAVVADIAGSGELQARWIQRDAADRQVQVGVLQGSNGGYHQTINEAITKALPPNAELIDTAYTNENEDTARQAAQPMATDHPDLGYLIVVTERMALAARTGLDAAGATKVKIVTADGTDAGLAALKSGRFAATVSYSPCESGQLTVEITIALLRHWSAAKFTKGMPPNYCGASGLDRCL